MPSVMVAFSTYKKCMNRTFNARFFSPNKNLLTTKASPRTFIVEGLQTVWSQRPPVVMQIPSAHRPSEQGVVNAMLLLQPLSTDSACQLLKNAPSS